MAICRSALQRKVVLVYTSLWDNYPDSISVMLRGKASACLSPDGWFYQSDVPYAIENGGGEADLLMEPGMN